MYKIRIYKALFNGLEKCSIYKISKLSKKWFRCI